ncbi:unnamed protein product [Hymenolepis diminuta]|uniref:Uncharacterized protein n=1 Tax=Hymenolepis diminuta TaxID=6216 RepID=A0A564YCW4_HYMDI|nr:unnamed protein product [Hymenolepis diminuta]
MNSNRELDLKSALLDELMQEKSVKNVYTQFGDRVFVRADRMRVIAQCQKDIRRLQETESANEQR